MVQHLARYDGDYGGTLFDQRHDCYIACRIGICDKQQTVSQYQGEAECINPGVFRIMVLMAGLLQQHLEESEYV